MIIPGVISLPISTTIYYFLIVGAFKILLLRILCLRSFNRPTHIAAKNSTSLFLMIQWCTTTMFSSSIQQSVQVMVDSILGLLWIVLLYSWVCRCLFNKLICVFLDICPAVRLLHIHKIF